MTARIFPLFLLPLMVLTACATETRPPKLELNNASYKDVPGWQQDATLEALNALRRSCETLKGKSNDDTIGTGLSARPAWLWKQSCSAAESTQIVTDADAKKFFETYFQPYLAANYSDADGLFTGYYEPILQGARKRSETYRYPVYKLPRNKRGFSRKQIDNGALKKKNLEIAWVEDPYDLFFMHIQGSGRIALEDGEEIRVNYAGQNGKEYVSIGKVLIDRGVMEKEQVNMASLKAWLQNASAEEARELLWQNPSYIYFRVNEGDGPLGAQGVVLTPERSLAVDPSFVPLGTPVFIKTTLPDGQPYQRLMIAQDKGGAIKGPVRGDVFFGAGNVAGEKAGYMKQRGEWYLLLPKETQIVQAY